MCPPIFREIWEKLKISCFLAQKNEITNLHIWLQYMETADLTETPGNVLWKRAEIVCLVPDIIFADTYGDVDYRSMH